MTQLLGESNGIIDAVLVDRTKEAWRKIVDGSDGSGGRDYAAEMLDDRMSFDQGGGAGAAEGWDELGDF